MNESIFRQTNRCIHIDSGRQIRTEIGEEHIRADRCRQTNTDSGRDIRTEVDEEHIQADRCIQRRFRQIELDRWRTIAGCMVEFKQMRNQINPDEIRQMQNQALR
ncbi:hypothetical protein Tco_0908891 [Tanacetum coccineum]|uniref:Uncharacterized protein n=1 Tax=Tanacetum coccineum TaxID=301880 RepID=A0ABQ5CNF7_9ASTR